MKMFTGLYTAQITPFKEDGSLDREGLISLIQRQKDTRVDGIVALGTTGEAPTLSLEEKREVVSITRQHWPKATLLVGTGAYSTSLTIQSTQEAEKLGADGALIICPYYNKPTQEGLYAHFKAVAAATNLPILLYNHIGRTGVHLNAETVAKLSQLPNIVGIKEASYDLTHLYDLIHQTPEDFTVLSGDDPFTFPLMSLGGDGVISVLGNLIPETMKSLTSSLQSGDYNRARELHYSLIPFFKGASLETNPIPIKAAMQIAGLPSGNPRLPLTQISDKHYTTLKKIIAIVPPQRHRVTEKKALSSSL